MLFFSIQSHLSWELIASFSFCLRLDNTPAAWWNGAESGPALFARPKACLWLGMELKTKPCAILCNYKHTHAQRNYFMCRFFFCPHRGDSCQTGRIGQPVDEPFILFAMADSSYEMDTVTHCWAPKIRGQYIHNRTQMVWVRGHKLSHYLKLKLKTLWKPNEIYHFPVNTKCIHRRLLLTCNLQCQAALLPSPTTSVPLRVVCAVMLKMVDLEVFYLVALILFYSSVS